jgi:hypothetical protein
VKLLRAPALHMALIGALLFAGALFWSGLPGPERPRIVISPQRLDLVRQTFERDNGRPPAREEWVGLVDAVIDHEVLYQYALRLRMHEQPVAQRRLAQIASFEESNPDEAKPDSEAAAQAITLGLHQSDLVVRRILADGARRLIRAVVLTRQPNPAMVEEYLAANPAPFRRPARTRITHVMVNAFKWQDTAKARADALLDRLRREATAPEAAPSLGDEPFVSSTLPLLTSKDIQTRFGVKFAEALETAPEQTWSGPFPSRFGYHLVWVHERKAAYVPPLAEIRPHVEQRFLHKVADEWLALRLQQLRAEFDIVVPGFTP